MKKGINILFIICGLLQEAVAQNKKFAVFFNRKLQGNPYSISSPQEFLSARSIQRRQNQILPLDSTDLPVIPSYLNSIRATGASVLYQLRWLNGAIVDCNESQFQAIIALPFVTNGSPLNARITGSPVRNLPKSGVQSLEYGQSASQNAQLDLDSMHSWGYHGEGKLIAVMDAGFRNVHTHAAFAHLFQNQKLKGIRDLVDRDNDVFLDHPHGTTVLSNIAAFLPGSIIGGAYAADFFLIRSEDAATENEIECAYWVAGLELADSIGADVVNSSLGYTTFDTPSLNYTYSSLNGETSLASKAASMAASKGIIVVNSAGNEGSNSAWGGWISVPSDAKNILTAGAADVSGMLAGFSGKGPTSDGRIKPDLIAMGSGTTVVNAFSSNGITTSNGTSFSAPMLTGLVAGFWQAHPEKAALDVINLLKNSGSNRETPNSSIGWGLPSFIRAHINAGANPNLAFPVEVKVYPNPALGNEIVLSCLPTNINKPLNYQLFDSMGKKIRNGIFNQSSEQAEVRLPTSGYRAGTYFLEISNDKGSMRKKIILN